MKKKKKFINHIPSFLVISRRFLMESLMYIFLALSEAHRPCFDINLSLTLFSAAADAPPDLKLCKL